MPALPETSAGFADATWESLAPYYRALDERTAARCGHPAGLAGALVAARRAGHRGGFPGDDRLHGDTADKAKESAHLRFSTEVLPQLEEAEVALAKRFVAIGTDRAGPADDAAPLPHARSTSSARRTSRWCPRPRGWRRKYQQITGTMTAEWDGERVPLPRLSPFLKSHDRSVREAAWRAATMPYVAAPGRARRPLFDRMVDLRQTMARNAGFADFRDFSFAAKCRFDYTPGRLRTPARSDREASRARRGPRDRKRGATDSDWPACARGILRWRPWRANVASALPRCGRVAGDCGADLHRG